jgi:hypothetical protein
MMIELEVKHVTYILKRISVTDEQFRDLCCEEGGSVEEGEPLYGLLENKLRGYENDGRFIILNVIAD